ncbi:MAG: hypothetical protein E7462_06070 [Ruminococcaceae bacterium]|nr:hypothetical protein [Oscillospiraceae bacterium]
MGYFAVIDTETNWVDRVMSIGTVIADCDTFQPVDMKYHVLTPEYEIGGMYENELFSDPNRMPVICSRAEALNAILCWLSGFGVTDIYAYNASFDRNHLPELSSLVWHDIIRIAAYRQYNPKIPASAECCSTGRMKRNYGVEPMLKLLSGAQSYRETHNALLDALDELEIMRLLGLKPRDYIKL